MFDEVKDVVNKACIKEMLLELQHFLPTIVHDASVAEPLQSKRIHSASARTRAWLGLIWRTTAKEAGTTAPHIMEPPPVMTQSGGRASSCSLRRVLLAPGIHSGEFGIDMVGGARLLVRPRLPTATMRSPASAAARYRFRPGFQSSTGAT